MTDTSSSTGEALLFRLFVAVAALVVIVSIGLPLVGVRVFHGADIVRQHEPWRNHVALEDVTARPPIGDTVDAGLPARAVFAREARQGDIALWNPYPSGGAPLGSIPTGGVLGPLNIPYLLLPVWLAPAFAKLLEMTVAIGFTFLFLRRLRLARPSALIGGFIYAFSGFQIVWTNWGQPHVGALIPALFWAVERHIQLRTRRSIAPIAVVIAAMLLENFPSVTGYACFAVGAWALMRLVANDRGRIAQVKTLMSAGFAVALGIGLAAFQIVPFLSRLRVVDLEYRAQSPDEHLPLSVLITSVVPDAFGSGIGKPYFATVNIIEAQSFVGVTAIVLAVVALGRWGAPSLVARARVFFVSAAALALLLGYVGGPLLALFQRLPLFESHFVGRIRSVLGFFVAVLAAIGIERLLQSDRSTGWSPGPTGVWDRIRASAAPMVAILTFGILLVKVARDLDGRGRMDLLFEAARAPAVALVIGLTALLIAGHTTRATLRQAAIATIPVAFAIEALALALPFWPRIPRSDFYPSSPVHEFLDDKLESDRFVSHAFTMYPGTNVFYELRSVTGHAFADARWQDLLLHMDRDAYASATFSILHVTPEIASSPLLDRMAARYLVMPSIGPVLGELVSVADPAGEAALRHNEPAIATIPGGPLRGVGIHVLDSKEEVFDRFGRVDVSLSTGDGRVVASGSRRLFARVTPGLFVVPVAGEELGSEALQVRVTLEAPRTRELRIAASTSAPIALEAVRPKAGDGLRVALAEGSVVYERLTSARRMRWASRAVVETDPTDRLARLSAPLPLDTIVLEEPSHLGSGKPGRVSVLHDDGDVINLEVTAEGDGYVVLADPLQHDWRATVDGEDAPILRADHAMVAVPVPEGRHRVEVTYDPPGRKAGFVLSGLSVATLAAMCTTIPRVRRRHASKPTGS